MPPLGSVPPLFDAFPGLAARLPYLGLGDLPTPIVRAETLGADTGLRSLYLKRDDRSGVYGGGKVRKLELLLADALRLERELIVTSGGVGSNHAAAATIYAERCGLRTRLLLLPEPASEHAAKNLRLMAASNAELRLVSHESLEREIVRAQADPLAYVIPGGGSSSLGNVGFVNAAFELARQIEADAMPEPAAIYLAMGTMGSAAGLAVGLAAAGLVRTRVVAVRASSPVTSDERRLRAAIAETNAFLRAALASFPDVSDAADRVEVDSRHLGAGYAIATPASREALDRARRLEGLALETTYTGKALAALLDARARWRDRVVLFWCSNDSRSEQPADLDARAVPAALHGWLAPSIRD